MRDRAKATDWADQGVELLGGDWTEPGALNRALEGVNGAFIMLPPIYTPSRDFRESRGLVEAYAHALNLAQLQRIVVVSSNGAEKSNAITPLSFLESALGDNFQ